MHAALRRLLATAAGALLLTGLTVAPAAHAHHEPSHPTSDEAATDWNNYERITLTKNVGEPIDLAVMPDGRVLHTARTGDIRLTDPAAGTTRLINQIPVYSNSEDGLQTINLDPDFENNNWVYVFYSPQLDTPSGSAPQTLPPGEDDSYWDRWLGHNQLSRFQWDEETEALDLDSEQVIIEIEVQRGQCCHLAGDVAWDTDGNLYLATGDNTPASTPGANGYAPNNDAPGRNPGYDARRSSGNTNDLRGKILRISVNEDGSYDIPDGNLFEPGTEDTRPEIYVMGLRNPFRMAIDPETDGLMWGEYGPDAGTANPNRGPMGYVEWQSTSQPFNAGWPYCHGPNANYNEWDFATATPGPWFDCDAGAENNSRWNTGLDQVPPVGPEPQLWYGDTPEDQPWPELQAFNPNSRGQGPMGGPMYRYDPDNPSPTKLPEYWDGKAFFGEFSQNYMAAFTIDDPDGPVTRIENFLPNDHLDSIVAPPWRGIIDFEFGPDGSLYVLEYGTGFFRQNPDAGLYRIDWAEGNKAPIARFDVNATSGHAPLEVEFDASASFDPEGEELTYDWDFTGDGEFTASGVTATHTFTENGQFHARLRVTDPSGKFTLTSRVITIGNIAPTVELDPPADGGFFDWGDEVPYEMVITDPEDGDDIDCSRATWQLGIGHDNHAHPGPTGNGCSGTIPTPTDSDHGVTENTYGVFVATYTDGGADDIPAASGEASIRLTPKLREAEWADEIDGGDRVRDDDASGLHKVADLDADGWIAFDGLNLTRMSGVTLRASSVDGGTVTLAWDAPDGPVIGEIEVPATGDTSSYTSASTFLEDTGGATGTLYVTTSGGVDLDALTFRGSGVAAPPDPADLLEELTQAVTSAGTDGALDRRVEKPMSARLRTAARHLGSGNLALARSDLERFQELARDAGLVDDTELVENLFWGAQEVIDNLDG